MAQVTLTINTFPAHPDTKIFVDSDEISVVNGCGSKKVTKNDPCFVIITNATLGENYETAVDCNRDIVVNHNLCIGFNLTLPSGAQATTIIDGVEEVVGSSAQLDAYDKETTITVSKSGSMSKDLIFSYIDKAQTREVTLSESGSTPTLTVSCDTPGAEIQIGTITTNTVSGAGVKFVKVSKEGYYLYSKKINLSDKDVDLIVNLKPERIKEFQLVYPVYYGEYIHTLRSSVKDGYVHKIFFNLTPKDFKLREYDPASDTWKLKSGLKIEVSTEDNSNIIEDFSLQTWDSDPAGAGGRPVSSNSYYYFNLELKPNTSGQIKLYVDITDGYRTISSDPLEFEVFAENYYNGSESVMYIPKVFFSGRSYNLYKYVEVLTHPSSESTNQTRRRSSPVYISLINNDDNIAEVDTDGVTVIPKAPGKISIMRWAFWDSWNHYYHKEPVKSTSDTTASIVPASPSLSGIEIFLPSFEMAGGENLGRDNRCFASYPEPENPPHNYDQADKYSIGYKLTPSSFPMTLPGTVDERKDIKTRFDIVSGLEYVKESGISTNFGIPKFNISFLPMEVDDIPRHVEIKMYIEDLETGEEVGSNVLDLEIRPKVSMLGDPNYFVDQYSSSPTVKTDTIILKAGEPFDCRQLVSLDKKVYRGQEIHKGISRYITVSPSSSSNSASAFTVDTDQTTIVARNATWDSAVIIWKKISVMYGGAGNSVPSWSTSWVEKIPVVVLDEAELLCLDEDFRRSFKFSIDEIKIDRSDTGAYPYTYFHSEFPDGTTLPENYDSLFKYTGNKLGANLACYLNKYYNGKHCISEFLEYSNPGGKFDWGRLKFRFEDAAGNPLSDMSVPNRWAEGTVWIAAIYGKIEEFQVKARTKFTMWTSNPQNIPLRDDETRFYGGRTEVLDADFTKWYPLSKVLSLIPRDATVKKYITDGILHLSNSSTSIGFIGFNEVAYVEEINKNATNIDERFRVRFAGVGYMEPHFIWQNYWGGGGGAYPFRVDHINSDGTTTSAPSNVELIPLKSEIKRGEYTAIKTKFTPEGIDYTVKDLQNGFVYQGWYFNYDGGNWVSASKIMEAGYINIICSSRRGVIIQGGLNAPSGEHTIGVRLGYTYTTTFKLLVSTYTAPSGSLSINVRKDASTGALIHDQTITLSGGTPAFWNSGEWRLASIDSSGHVITYTAGVVDLYAVTTDGRLVKGTYSTPSSLEGYLEDLNNQIEESGGVVVAEVDPLEDLKVDEDTQESVLAESTIDDMVFSLEGSGEVVFDSAADDPEDIRIKKSSSNYRINSICVISDNPKVATAEVFIDANSQYFLRVTPTGKGSTVIRMVCGGAAPVSVNVNVTGGTAVTYSPNLEYNGVYGVTLSAYEYALVNVKVKSQGVYDDLELTVPETCIGRIIPTKEGYNASTKIATIKIELRARVSGYVYLNYGTEKLMISVANRFWLKFKDPDENFELGRGASRDIVIFPLDDSIKMSEVWLDATKGYVSIGKARADIVDGKRAFIVPITCLRAGSADDPLTETLQAGIEGEEDISLDFRCVTKDIPPEGIAFNVSSISVNLPDNNN